MFFRRSPRTGRSWTSRCWPLPSTHHGHWLAVLVLMHWRRYTSDTQAHNRTITCIIYCCITTVYSRFEACSGLNRFYCHFISFQLQPYSHLWWWKMSRWTSNRLFAYTKETVDPITQTIFHDLCPVCLYTRGVKHHATLSSSILQYLFRF